MAGRTLRNTRAKSKAAGRTSEGIAAHSRDVPSPRRSRMKAVRRDPIVVIGAGQAGLAASWWLTRLGREHVVLERSGVAASWRERRWDSFRLVTPNWMVRLPGAPEVADPGGFLG